MEEAARLHASALQEKAGDAIIQGVEFTSNQVFKQADFQFIHEFECPHSFHLARYFTGISFLSFEL